MSTFPRILLLNRKSHAAGLHCNCNEDIMMHFFHFFHIFLCNEDIMMHFFSLLKSCARKLSATTKSYSLRD